MPVKSPVTVEHVIVTLSSENMLYQATSELCSRRLSLDAEIISNAASYTQMPRWQRGEKSLDKERKSRVATLEMNSIVWSLVILHQGTDLFP